MGIRPSRNIARGEYAGYAGFEIFVDCNAAVDGEASLLRQRDRRPYTHAENHEIRIDDRPIAHRHPAPIHAADSLSQMKYDPVRLVQLADEFAHLAPQHALERGLVRRNNVDLDAACA